MAGRNPHWPILLGAGAAALAATAAQAQVWRFHEPHVLGASLDLAVVAADPASALTAARAARAEIARLDGVLSGWRPDSELAALNAQARWTASPDLFAVIEAAEDWRRRTGGAFDGRLGRLIRASRQGGDAPELTEAAVSLDPAARAIRRAEAAVFDLDGIAKGHVIDAALAAARRAAPGAAGVMIDIGGDVRVWGQGPGAVGLRLAGRRVRPIPPAG